MSIHAIDTFTAANGTEISARSSDSGHSWVKRDQTAANLYLIQGNAAALSPSGGINVDGYNYDVDPGAIYQASIRCKHSQVSGGTLRLRVFVRASTDLSVRTWYMLSLERNVGTGVKSLLLVRSVAGTQVTLASIASGATFNADTFYKLTLQTYIDGSGNVVLVAYQDDVEALRITDSDASKITANGRASFGGSGAAGDTITWDDFDLRSVALFAYTGFEDVEEFGSFGFEIIKSFEYSGFEDVEEFGSFGFARISAPPYLEVPEVGTFADFPDDELYYGSAEDEISGKRYYNRLSGAPSISEEIPEFFAGIEPPQQTVIYLENLDEEVSNHRKLGKLKRGNRVILTEKWRARNAETEIINIYRGIINNSEPASDIFIVNSQSLWLDILGNPFPDSFVDTEKWPLAHPSDLGSPIGFFIGTAKHVPLALVKVQDDISGIDFRYLCGEGDINIVAVYRDGRYMEEYTGIFQSGSTTTAWKLAASDSQSNDFYKDTFITNNANGQTRRITAYVKSTKIATVTPSGTAPTSGQTYTIKRWQKIVETIASKDYTVIQFVIPMYDLSGNELTKANITGDLNGYQTERVPTEGIMNLLSRYTDKINEDAFAEAAAYLSTIPLLKADGGVYDPRPFGDIIEELALIGRARLTLDEDGNVYPVIDGTQDTVIGPFRIDTMARVGIPKETPLESVWKDLTLKFRRQFNGSEYTLKTSPHDVLPEEGRISEVKPFDFLFEKEPADMVCDYMAKVRRAFDKKQPFSFGYEARSIKKGALLNIDLPEFGKEAIYEATGRRAVGIDVELEMAEYDPSRTTWGEGAYFDDPIGDGIDYSKTPPKEVSTFAAVWSITTLNVSAKASLSWVKPTTNFDHVVIEFKRSADPTWTFAGTSTGTTFDIPGLIPGTLYDFRATSINIFNFPPTGGGVATIVNSLAPGDTTAPATPTGLSGSAKLHMAEIKWNKNGEGDIRGYDYDVRTASGGGGSLIKSGFTEDISLMYKLTDGDLTTAVTRHFRVRAVDFTGNVSAYTSSVSVTSGDVTRPDARNLDFNRQNSNSNDNSTSLSITPTAVISTSLACVAGQNVFIHFGAIIKNTSTSARAYTLRITRNGSVIWGGFANFNIVTPDTEMQFSNTITDDPGAGTFTYAFEAAVTVLPSTIKFRVISVNQYKR